MPPDPPLTGLEALLQNVSALAGKRIGLLANPASTARFVPAPRALLDAGLNVRVLFGPEHGLTGSAQDMEAVASGEPAHLPVISLYGERFEDLAPLPEHLDGLDAVVSDLPDVGSRYYTFVWTTALMMKACAARGLPVWVLDRPNPLGGERIEGNLPDDDRLLSFVGLHPLPVRHGLTPGEIARLVNAEQELGCDLHVVPMRCGSRPLSRSRVGEAATWVMPSPNMPTPETALVYPGSCLFEGTNLSEGRGTTRPFELVGAPWLDAERAAAAANSLELPGVRFRPHVFKPTFHKHAGRMCGGVQLHVTDRARFRPYETGLKLLKALRDLEPGVFCWRTEAYEYRDDVPAIDLLTGTERYRRLVDAGEPLREWIEGFEKDVARFRVAREKHLLYRGEGLPPVIQIVGAHESGKTAVAVKVIEALVAQGLRVGSVKHTDHEYETDVLGKDSQRHKAAGANPALLVAGRRTAAHRSAGEPPRLAALLERELAGADVVVVEGYRQESYPKVEVVRRATGRGVLAAEDPSVIAVVTDVATAHLPSVPRVSPGELGRLLTLVRIALGLASEAP